MVFFIEFDGFAVKDDDDSLYDHEGVARDCFREFGCRPVWMDMVHGRHQNLL